MASVLSVHEASELLKCQTLVLKVSIHCEGCKKNVKKVLQRIEDVYTTAIEAEQNSVTDTGNFEVETLIKKLIVKTGKHAEVWPENHTRKAKIKSVKESDKQNAAEILKRQRSTTCDEVGVPSCNSARTITSESNTSKCNKEEKCKKSKKGQLPRQKSPRSQASQQAKDPKPSEKEKMNVDGKRKNRKGQKDGVVSSSFRAPASRGSQHYGDHNAGVDLGTNMYPMDYQSHLAFNANDNSAAATQHPSISLDSHYSNVPLLHNTAAAANGEETNRLKALYLNTLQIFSDENANACTIM